VGAARLAGDLVDTDALPGRHLLEAVVDLPGAGAVVRQLDGLDLGGPVDVAGAAGVARAGCDGPG
jgi:hypothetical protein